VLKNIYTNSSKESSLRKLKDKYQSTMKQWISKLRLDGRPGNSSTQTSAEVHPIGERVNIIYEQMKEKEESELQKKALTKKMEKIQEITCNPNEEGITSKKIRENEEMVSDSIHVRCLIYKLIYFCITD
jgi:hypothetical protein